MKKLFLSLTLLSIAYIINITQAQVAAKKGVTLEEIHYHINILSVKNDNESRELLLLEAEELVKSDKERWLIVGANLYTLLKVPTEANKAFEKIAKKFPKGLYVRNKEYSKIFDLQSKFTHIEKEKLYMDWEKKFPANSYEEHNRNIYLEGDANMAVLFINESNIDKAIDYIEKFRFNPNYPIYINRIGSELIKNNNHELAITLLEPAYEAAHNATLESSNVSNKVSLNRAYFNLTPNFAKALLETNRNEKAIEILEELIRKNAGKNASSIRQLANAYTKIGRDLDAFILLQNYLANNESDERTINQVRPLYIKLNQNNEGNLEKFIASLTQKSNNIITSKLKDVMIKKEAPNFSLLNMKGEKVTLSDLRGKVVVLDFWATWCGPCKQSFPGMQAAVDKYKDDKDVVFLFIDVWQKEENYKELAQQFIAENKYSFNVLFDEMNDRPKSTATAYGVQGVPTKIVIDREGFIRFESAGGSTEISKIVSDMSAKIELARKE